MVLAHFIHDSEGFNQRRERVDIDNYPDSYKDSTCDAPGQSYFGRGYLKIRTCKNYLSMDLFSDDRLVKDPDIVASDDETVMKAGFAFWNRNVLGFPGVSDGQFGATTNATGGPNTHIARKRYQIYKEVRKAFNLKENPGAEDGCYAVSEFMNISNEAILK